jgi:hypothetical protein
VEERVLPLQRLMLRNLLQTGQGRSVSEAGSGAGFKERPPGADSKGIEGGAKWHGL